MTLTHPAFIAALHSPGPAEDRADKLALYGQFVGSWDFDIVVHAPGGTDHRGRGEIHFDWVLEGRAIQDVWMIPPRAERGPAAPALPLAGNWYGTTLRVYDPQLDAWHIFWSDPATNYFARQLGRAHGADIVQVGTGDSAGSRWSFTEITADSFHWLGETSQNGGASWYLLVEIFARRRLGASQ